MAELQIAVTIYSSSPTTASDALCSVIKFTSLLLASLSTAVAVGSERIGTPGDFMGGYCGDTERDI